MGVTIPPFRTSDRVIALGKSGSGKTIFLKRMLVTQPNVIVIDTKKNENWSKVGKYVYGDKIKRVTSGRHIWVPNDSFLHDKAEQEHYLDYLYKAGGRVIYVDEFGDIAPTPQTYPRALKTLAMRGRSAGVGLWGTTQRPHGVPLFLLSEANHYACFYTSMPQDRKRIEIVMEEPIDWSAIPHESYRFFYKGRGRTQGPTSIPPQEVL